MSKERALELIHKQQRKERLTKAELDELTELMVGFGIWKTPEERGLHLV